MDPDFNYDDVSSYTLDDEDERLLVAFQDECTFMWATQEGWPVGVIMSYVFEDQCFWLSVSSLRVRVRALQRDPRASIAITSKGTDIPGAWSLTYKGRCEVRQDRETIDWFLPALARRLRAGDAAAQRDFVRLNDTPNRRVIRFVPERKIGFDGRKMARATRQAIDRSPGAESA